MEDLSISFGKMNTFIDLIETLAVKDAEGFSTETDNILASIRAYQEGRHGSKVWANRAAFTEATDLFCFRRIPGITVTTAMYIVTAGRRFEITSVENIKGRGLYVEVLAKEVKPSG